MARKVKKELDTPERFEEVLRDELSVSAEFDLPPSALALHARESFEVVRRALEARRVADLICRPDPAEMLVVLPNTKVQDARVGEARPRKAVPEDAFGVAVRGGGDEAENLIGRARGAVDASGPSAGT